MKNLSIENITKACRGTFHGDKSILSQEGAAWLLICCH